MSIRDYLVTTLSALCVTPFVLLMLHVAGAQVMESTSYKIQSDSINFGGGLSTSDSYTLESTMGEVATGDMSGDTFNLRAGYQQMTGSFISITAADAVVMTPSIP